MAKKNQVKTPDFAPPPLPNLALTNLKSVKLWTNTLELLNYLPEVSK